MADSKITTITAVEPIPKADRLELIRLGNYQSVAPKGAYQAGDQVLYIFADAVLPQDRAWSTEYLKYAEKRVRIIKLRGVFSEGIIIPLSTFYKEVAEFGYSDATETLGDLESKTDQVMGITHYQPPLPHAEGALGPLPVYLPPTDATRWESFFEDYGVDSVEGTLTTKLDGTSATYLYDKDEDRVRVFSRNLEFKEDAHNLYTSMVEKYDLTTLLREYPDGYALRGEIHGAGIQQGQGETQFTAFSIFDTKAHTYIYLFGLEGLTLSNHGVPLIPVISSVYTLTAEYGKEISESLGADIEGYVLWPFDKNLPAVKVLSKAYDEGK